MLAHLYGLGRRRRLRRLQVRTYAGRYEGVPGIDLPGLDFVALAQGMDCPGTRIEDPKLLPDALAAALRQQGPMLVEVAVDAAIPTLYHKG